jgi:hypothetical protein
MANADHRTRADPYAHPLRDKFSSRVLVTTQAAQTTIITPQTVHPWEWRQQREKLAVMKNARRGSGIKLSMLSANFSLPLPRQLPPLTDLIIAELHDCEGHARRG